MTKHMYIDTHARTHVLVHIKLAFQFESYVSFKKKIGRKLEELQFKDVCLCVCMYVFGSKQTLCSLLFNMNLFCISIDSFWCILFIITIILVFVQFNSFRNLFIISSPVNCAFYSYDTTYFIIIYDIYSICEFLNEMV